MAEEMQARHEDFDQNSNGTFYTYACLHSHTRFFFPLMHFCKCPCGQHGFEVILLMEVCQVTSRHSNRNQTSPGLDDRDHVSKSTVDNTDRDAPHEPEIRGNTFLHYSQRQSPDNTRKKKDNRKDSKGDLMVPNFCSSLMELIL